jgi:ribosomal protein S24E
LRTRKFITNRLLARKQFVLEVLHPGRANVSKADLAEKLASQYKSDKARVVVFGLRTQFGGGRSTGFGLIYDDEASQKKFEPRYRLVRVRVGCWSYEGLLRWNSTVSLALEPSLSAPPVSSVRSVKIVPRRLVYSALSSYCPYIYPPGTRYRQGEGCRASEEGQVRVTLFNCLSLQTLCTHGVYAMLQVVFLSCIFHSLD